MPRGEQAPRPRARRRKAALALAVLLLLLPAAILLLIRLPAVESRVLAIAFREAREATGLSIRARGLSIEPLSGRVRLRGVVAAVPGSRPFLDVAEAEVEVDTGEALRRRIHIRRLALRGVRIDLGAPLPASQGTGRAGAGASFPPVEIDEIDIGISSIVSGPFAPALQRVALAARLEKARVTGSLRRGALSLRADLPSLVVDRPGPLRLRASGAFGLSLTPAGRLLLEGLHLSGEGFSATASGTGGLSPDAPLALHAEMEVTPETIAPELLTSGAFTLSADVKGRHSDLSVDLSVEGRDVATAAAAFETLSARLRLRPGVLFVDDARAALLPRGRVEGTGRLDLSSGDGTFALRAQGLPDDLLDTVLDEASRARLGLAGSELDAVATVRHGSGDPLPFSVDADLSLRRGALPLALAKVRLSSRGEATLDIAATLLPASPGERTASGQLRARSLAALASGRLVDARLQAAVPDLSDAITELNALFPALTPPSPANVDLGGALRLDVRAAGPLRAPAAQVEASFFPFRGGSLSLHATADAGRRTAEGEVAAAGLPLDTFRPGVTGLASADATFAVGPKRRDIRLSLDASGLCVDESAPLLHALHADIVVDEAELRVLRLAASTGERALASPASGARVDASGRASLDAPWADADLDLSISVAGVRAEAHATTRDGVLGIAVPRAGTPGLEGIVSARLALGALRAVPAIAPHLPSGLPGGPLEVTLDAPGLDSCALEKVLPAGTPLVHLVANLRGFATLDLADLLAGTAELAIEGLAAETVAGHFALAGPARLTLGGGRLALEEIAVEGKRTSFVASAAADLVPGARPGVVSSDLLARVTASVRGRADAALLSPFLAGGTAAGAIALDVSAAGPPDALEGRVFLDGQGSRFSWPLAWPTEIRDPLLEAELTPGAASLTRGEALLNGGPVLLSGGFVRDKGISLTALFADVRYRLAYGLAAILSGELKLDMKGEERRISGNVTLDRGLLERDVDLDREILARVLAPPETAGTETSFLDTLALDVGVGTASGVRIRNNVADLSASWSRLDVTGTARRPVVRGRIDVAKGGLVFAYGQTFRVDKGAVTYTGDPATDPRLDFVTTSSLKDRTIAPRAHEGDLFAEARASTGNAEGEVDAAAELARGLAGYYGDRLASRLGAALGRVSLSIRPLFLLGETDPAARLTLSRDFSPSVSLAVSFDLKNAQRQTWVVDVHGLRRLPPLAAQVFTEDFGRYGGILQQRIEIGGTRRPRDEDSAAGLLAELRLTPPRGVPRRALISAMGLRRKEPASRAVLFEAQIDAEAFLRDRGWPDAQVSLRAVPARKAGRVDVEASIDPGPRVEVAFEGDRLPAASRTAVAGLYRTGALEAGALEEMRRETCRALRALGHLEPEAEVTAQGDRAERRVAVRARAGRKVEIREVAVEGVSAREAGVLARRFGAPLERVELAAALPSADRRLLESLHALGYPKGRILERTLSKEGRLALRVDPGLPSLVEHVEVRGVPPEEAEKLGRLVRLSPGEPADADRTALSALAMEDALRAGGFAEARVRAVLSPASPEDPPRLAVAFDVTKGKAESLGSVTVEGLARTNAGWARRVAGLAPGTGFLREAVDAARGELFSLGLFRSVRGESIPGDGRVDVVLTAEELPPLTVAYGLRWENERGFSAVVDVADRNLLGRGLTLGLRALYDPNDRALRAFAGLPEVLLGFGVDAWAERRKTLRVLDGFELETDATEVSLQLSRSLGRGLSARLYGRWKETRVFADDPFFPFDVTTRLPYAGAQLVRDTREDPLLGTRGLLASLDVQGSGSWLGSSFAFARAYGQVNVYRPVFVLGAGRAVWAQSVRLGFARAFAGQTLIPDVRFFAGGSYSVRGYRTESLGPREDLGGTLFATGGSTLFVVNEELRVPLHPRLLGVGFFDAGQVWTSSRDFGTGLATSIGAGVRALTPVGVLRLDGAFPLTRRPGDPPFIVTFGFGNVF